MVEPLGASELRLTVIRPGLATAGAKETVAVSWVVPVTPTLTLVAPPTAARAPSAFLMLLASVAGVLFQLMLPVLAPLKDRRNVPPATPVPKATLCVGAST